jgi:xylan 1,4-beta-xylosidase
LLSDEVGQGDHGNFTGAFVGMAAHDVSGQAMTADFDYFEYQDLA